MKFLIFLLLSLRLATNTVASQRALPNPWVESIVDFTTQEFSPYITFKGHPHPHHPGSPETQASTTSSSTPKPTETSTNTPEGYWLSDMHHQGVAAFNPNPGYKVFRNVKDYGVRGIHTHFVFQSKIGNRKIGDGLHDDTAAINFAISQGGRCGPGVCKSSTTTPAIVYFPSGTYLLSCSIIDFYFTQLIGNPNHMPVLEPMSNFAGFGLIDGNQVLISLIFGIFGNWTDEFELVSSRWLAGMGSHRYLLSPD
jgi:glucan 1,3-beta-glucosidase